MIGDERLCISVKVYNFEEKFMQIKQNICEVNSYKSSKTNMK